MRRCVLSCAVCVFVLSVLVLFPAVADAQPSKAETPAISGGAEAAAYAARVRNLEGLQGSPTGGVPFATPFTPGIGFMAYNFDDNATETGGSLFIPPDPCGAAGTDRVIAVTNVGIDCRDKAGVLIFRDALRDFFSPLGGSTLGTFTFDPKIVYDHYEGRFVVVTLERWDTFNGDPSNESRILVAVSKTATPATATAADWWYMAINSKTSIGGVDTWIDYPGFEIDEEAVYVTGNMFGFGLGGSFQGNRIWIIDKGTAAGFYAGGPAAFGVHDPVPGGFFALTQQPALVFGAGGVGGAGSVIGTYLVGFDGLTDGVNEYIQVIRIDNPLAATTFTGEFVNIGNIDDLAVALPDAPQLGTATLVEVNDRRALDAVWRNNNLWLTTTILPNAGYDPNNVGETTAHWVRLNTSVSPTAFADKGNIGGEDIANDTWTFFPAVAVNANDDAKFGFAASSQTIFPGAYFAGRESTDPPGTVQASGVVQAGLDWYVRIFAFVGGTRNRWGDYTGAAVDPTDDMTFWIFNEYAETRGTPLGGEDGRWGTAWRSCAVQTQDELDWGDAPDPSYPTLLLSNGANHTIVPGIFMGALIDAEPDGQPNITATGDDTNNLPDEDGVFFVGGFTPGGGNTANVTVSVDGQLDVWADWNQNGSWLDPGELVYSGPVVAGVNPIPIPVPLVAVPGQTYMRFRFNVGGPLPVDGPAQNGEVEDYEIFVDELPDLDYGDAPDPSYPTLLANDGARHASVPNVFLGGLIDVEPDGQPDPFAKGDDIVNLPDEDGVVFVTPLIPGGIAQVDVIASTSGFLDAWVDFGQDGAWGAADLIYSGGISAGLNSINFVVPAGSVPGLTFSRFRFNITAAGLAVTGFADNGEVEDYETLIEEPQDFGDAPDVPYPTLLASNGARHPVDPAVFMGLQIDSEGDGQPNATATGDDINNLADEDGVTFVTPLVPGSPAQVDVVVSVAGWLDIWFDFNQNGSWLDAGENVFSGPVVPGINAVPFVVPAVAVPGAQIYSRFRYNIAGAALPPSGAGPTGEVEDHVAVIEDALDFGDAPDPSYPTLLATNGARHVINPNVFMGALIDAEPDGQPNITATGDDAAGVNDEDGVAFITGFTQGQNAQTDVTVSVDGHLDVWADWDQDGSWLGGGELVFSGPVVAGVNPIIFPVPAAALLGQTYLRYRFNTAGALTVDGQAGDGEVEDYEIFVVEPQEELDFGDAPDPNYPTLLASNGARHVINPAVFMGVLIDPEADGQPNPTATGDDAAGVDDEDGVVFLSGFGQGQNAQLQITVSVPGQLDAWIDYNQNGSWLDAGEQVLSIPVVPGPTIHVVAVPPGATPGQTFLRVRFNTGAPLPPDGPATDGEVEDYEIFIEEVQQELDFGDLPDPPYRTLLANDGARHVIDPQLYLGLQIDSEPDGQPNGSATGDDINNLPDEDGVVFTPIIPLMVSTVTVTASAPGLLDAWIDFFADGVFGPGDQIFASVPLVPGPNVLNFNVPATGSPAYNSYARFRFSTAGGLAPSGLANDGEVEDYRVIIEEDPITGADTGMPTQYALHDAVPNPFNPQTTLSFSLPADGHVRLVVYDVEGHHVRTLLDERRDRGVHDVVWDGRDDNGRFVSSGVYFYRIEAGSFTKTKRMVLLK